MRAAGLRHVPHELVRLPRDVSYLDALGPYAVKIMIRRWQVGRAEKVRGFGRNA